MRSVCATSSTGYTPPNLRLMPRSAPLSVCAAVTIRTPRASSAARVSAGSVFSPGFGKPSTCPTITTGSVSPAASSASKSRRTVSPVLDAATIVQPARPRPPPRCAAQRPCFPLPALSKATMIITIPYFLCRSAKPIAALLVSAKAQIVCEKYFHTNASLKSFYMCFFMFVCYTVHNPLSAVSYIYYTMRPRTAQGKFVEKEKNALHSAPVRRCGRWKRKGISFLSAGKIREYRSKFSSIFSVYFQAFFT